MKWMELLLRLEDVGLRTASRALFQCGLGKRGMDGPEAALELGPCYRWFCPSCAHLRRRRMSKKWFPVIDQAMGPSGGCGFMTLTLARDHPAGERLDRLRSTLVKLRGKTDWRKAGRGWHGKVGVLSALEVGSTEGDALHPHVHLVVFGPDRQAVDECQAWILDTWLALNPSASPAGQDLKQAKAPRGNWRGLASYVFTGTQLDPSSSRETLASLMALIAPRMKGFSAWGRFGRIPARKKGAPSGRWGSSRGALAGAHPTGA
jgi:hypothetical protein